MARSGSGPGKRTRWDDEEPPSIPAKQRRFTEQPCPTEGPSQQTQRRQMDGSLDMEDHSLGSRNMATDFRPHRIDDASYHFQRRDAPSPLQGSVDFPSDGPCTQDFLHRSRIDEPLEHFSQRIVAIDRTHIRPESPPQMDPPNMVHSVDEIFADSNQDLQQRRKLDATRDLLSQRSAATAEVTDVHHKSPPQLHRPNVVHSVDGHFQGIDDSKQDWQHRRKMDASWTSQRNAATVEATDVHHELPPQMQRPTMSSPVDGHPQRLADSTHDWQHRRKMDASWDPQRNAATAEVTHIHHESPPQMQRPNMRSPIDGRSPRFADSKQDWQHMRKMHVSRDLLSQRSVDIVEESGSRNKEPLSQTSGATDETTHIHHELPNMGNPVDGCSHKEADSKRDSQQRRKMDESQDVLSQRSAEIVEDSRPRIMDTLVEASRDLRSQRIAEIEQDSPHVQRIVWPPVVIIQNTRVGWDHATNKWHGLEKEELKKLLKGVTDFEYNKVLSLYGPNGHRGKSLVVFPPDYLGFTEAQTLSECLQRVNRGKEQWERATYGLNFNSMKGWHSKYLVSDDGTRIIYGYLAQEQDMMSADPKKKIVKRWSMESYAEKVVDPMKETELAKEAARKKIEELEEEAKNKLVAVEQNKSEFGKKVEELKKVDEERQLMKKHEGELEAKHRRDFEARKNRYEEDKKKKFDQLRQQENEIRAGLLEHKAQRESEMAGYVELARKWKDEIDEEKRKHEVRLAKQKQIETMQQMELNSKLQYKMEKSLAFLDKSIREKLLKLQEQHNKEIMKSRKKIETEREELLENKLKELQGIEKEVNVAKDATEQIRKEAEERNIECIICFNEFGTERKERAHYVSCNHANVCIECAADLWKDQKRKQEKPLCPTCKTVQKKKFTSLPGKVYL